MLSDGLDVPVSLKHEPTNPYDGQALAFVCQINGKPYTIGYVVSELLDEVHAAIRDKNILSVKFAWIRYITDWTRSGPGFFAGIEMGSGHRMQQDLLVHDEWVHTYSQYILHDS